MAYCEIADVEALTQPSYKVYGEETVPNRLQVQKWIDSFGSQLRLKLRSLGYNLPISNDDDLEFLRNLNSWAAASIAESALDASVNRNELSEAGVDYWNKYVAGLGELEDRKLVLISARPSDLPKALHTSFAADGSDPDISDNRPMFRRDQEF